MNTSSTLANPNPISNMAGRAHQAVDDVAAKAAPAVDRASTAAHRTIDRVADAAIPAVDRATESGRQIVNKSNELAETCSGYVRARPLASIAGALAIGYLAGRLFR